MHKMSPSDITSETHWNDSCVTYFSVPCGFPAKLRPDEGLRVFVGPGHLEVSPDPQGGEAVALTTTDASVPILSKPLCSVLRAPGLAVTHQGLGGSLTCSRHLAWGHNPGKFQLLCTTQAGMQRTPPKL